MGDEGRGADHVTLVPRSSLSTGTAAPDTPLMSYPRSEPISPRTLVCFSGSTEYSCRLPLSSRTGALVVLRSSRKSGVSRPAATVDTTEAMPEGVARPDGVCRPSAGAASVASSSSSSSSSSVSSSSSSRVVVRSRSGKRMGRPRTFFGLQLSPKVLVYRLSHLRHSSV